MAYIFIFFLLAGALSVQVLSIQTMKKSTSSPGLGGTAPLNEAGYKAVASENSDKEIGRFIRRVIDEHGASIKDEGILGGVVSYYSGATAVQSYANLVEELAKSSWVQ